MIELGIDCVIMITKLKDKIRFHSYVKQCRGAKTDPYPNCEFHALEISTVEAKRPFITFYTKCDMSQGAQDKLHDILPRPYYNDDSIFHTDDNPASWTGCSIKYHVLYQSPPTYGDIIKLIKRLEELGRDVHPDIKHEINTYYNNLTEE